MRLRHLALATTMLVTGTAIGAATQHVVSADVSSGDRPVLVPVGPCRLMDSRPASQVGPRSAPLGAGDVHTVDAQEPGTPCSGLITSDAIALSLNVTALGATRQSFLTIWPGGDRPDASSLNPGPGAPPTPNAVTTSLSVDQEFEIYNDVGSVHVIVDVNGFYVNHNHDDRYLTETEANDRFIDAAELDAAIDDAIIAERRESAGRILAIGTVFGGSPARIEGNSRAADGLTLEATRLSDGRYILRLNGSIPSTTSVSGFPVLFVHASTADSGSTCLQSSASFSATRVSYTIECFDGSDADEDTTFRFIIVAPHADDA